MSFPIKLQVSHFVDSSVRNVSLMNQDNNVPKTRPRSHSLPHPTLSTGPTAFIPHEHTKVMTHMAVSRQLTFDPMVFSHENPSVSSVPLRSKAANSSAAKDKPRMDLERQKVRAEIEALKNKSTQVDLDRKRKAREEVSDSGITGRTPPKRPTPRHLPFPTLMAAMYPYYLLLGSSSSPVLSHDRVVDTPSEAMDRYWTASDRVEGGHSQGQPVDTALATMGGSCDPRR